MMSALLQAGAFLVEHADLIEDIVDALAHGAPKDAIRAAIREVKVQVSNAAFKEEMGV